MDKTKRTLVFALFPFVSGAVSYHLFCLQSSCRTGNPCQAKQAHGRDSRTYYEKNLRTGVMTKYYLGGRRGAMRQGDKVYFLLGTTQARWG